MVNIRVVKISDWKKLKRLLLEITSEVPPVALELEPLVYEGEEWIAQFPRGDFGLFVVAEEKDTIIGFCYVAVPKFYKPVAYIGMAIAREYRRKGLGSQMFYHVAEWATKKQLQYLIADVWNWNLKSLAFFESLGFIEKDRFKDKFKGKEQEKVRLVKRL